MSYEKVEPISIEKMLKTCYHGHNSICQTLRDIFIMTDSEEIKIKCRTAMAMAKKMHNKLKEYKAKEESDK